MADLRSALERADRQRTALGHFNVGDLTTIKAVVTVARELGVPVLVGVSEREREFLGVRQVSAVIRSIRDEFAHPVFLNADHTHSLEKAVEAARAGFDQVVFDASDHPFERNVAETRRAVEAVKSIDPAIVVEGEIGYIGSSSQIHDAAPEGMSALTTAEEARRFVEATAVDVLAPAVGNMHGLLRDMVSGERTKRLDIERIRAIRRAADRFLTLHGGSGTSAEDFAAAIGAGVTIVHINTEVRLAWRRGIEEALAASPDEIVPPRLLATPLERIAAVVRARLQLFSQPRSSSSH